MSRQSYALLTGLFVIALGAGLLAIANFLGGYQAERDVYLVVTQGSVSGLNPESTVIYRGVPAGKVSSIRFDATDVRNILVGIEVDKGLPITKGTFATLRVQGLTGLAQIELNDEGANPTPLPTDPDQPAQIPLRPSLIDKITRSGQDLLTELTQLAKDLGLLLNDGNRARLQSLLSNLDIASRELIAAAQQLNQALATWPALSQDARHTFAEWSRATRSFQETSEVVRKAARSVDDLAASGRAAGESLEKTTVPKVNALLADLQRTAASLKRLSEDLEQDPQALLLGPSSPAAGPGEPGYQEPPR